MRIGILTCHSGLNYGANLQLFANAKTLEAMGHEVVVYDNRDFPPGPCRAFVERNMTLTKRCVSDEDFRAETRRLEIDTILVGSDAVLWFYPNTRAGHGAYPNPFWLRWADGLSVRKVLVAASCMGVMYLKLGARMRRELRADLEAFDYISVRDRWTRAFLRWVGVKGADLVFDPTSCLPELFQPRAADLPEVLRGSPYLMLTFSGGPHVPPWVGELAAQARDAGYKTCFVPHPDRLCEVGGVDVCLNDVLDPLVWLSILGHSAGFVGERFHPIVLSAFYGIPFWACDYYSKAGLHRFFSGRSKTKDFCKRIGHGNRLISSDVFFQVTAPADLLSMARAEPRLESPADGDGFRGVLTKAVGAV